MKQTAAVLAVVILHWCIPVGHLQAHPVSGSDAQVAARGWLRADPHPLGVSLAPTIDQVEAVADATGEPLYYVVHLDSSGFIILAADDQVPPIIAFSASGAYDPAPAHPLRALLRNDLRRRVQAARTGARLPAEGRLRILADADQGTPAQRDWQTLLDWGKGSDSDLHIFGLPTTAIDDPRVDPLLEIERIRWGQKNLLCGEACYNYYTPRVEDGVVLWDPGNTDNYWCGCTATGMAQLMRFDKHPKDPISQAQLPADVLLDPTTQEKQTILRPLLGGTGPDGRYNWDLMDPRPDCADRREAQRREIGALCFDAGWAAKSTYASTGTAAGVGDAKEALLTIFRYRNAVYAWCTDCDQLAGLAGMINPNLDARRPVLLGIEDGTDGHVAVCDGYGYHLSTAYHHLNLGWNQSNRAAYDVWYNLPDVNAPDSSYNVVNECLYNIFAEATGEIISGRICDAQGVPLAHVTVRATSTDGSHTCASITDARGIYALVGCRSETEYLVQAEGVTYPTGPLARQASIRTGASMDRCVVSGNRWAVNFPVSAAVQGPRIVFVDGRATTGAGTGASWADAFLHLQDALSVVACDPDGSRPVEIWVAQGTYTPATGPEADRKVSFQLTNGAAVYGGFAGWETERRQRDPEAYPTILSGDLAGNDGSGSGPQADATRAENSYHVVRNCGNTVLDGFTIQAGNANGSDPNDLDWDEYGGALFISVGNPTIRGCRFLSNRADREGGAMYCDRRCSPVLSACRFMDNESTHGWGGAVFNAQESEPNFTGCTFVGNRAPEHSGGAVYNEDRSAALLTDCTFLSNQADWGGGIYNDPNSAPRLATCTFHSNQALQHSGGALYNDARSRASVRDCGFINNETPEGWGGAVYNAEESEPSFARCTFLSNRAPKRSGGALFNDDRSAALVTDCNFTSNQANWGGAVYNDSNSAPRLVACTFNNNQAVQQSGGALYNGPRSNASLLGCGFQGNQAQWGGAVYCENSEPNLVTCRFENNHATYGGGLCGYLAWPMLIACVFRGNVADHSGGALRHYDSSVIAVNCLFAGNKAASPTGGNAWGGAIVTYGKSTSCSIELINCTLAANSARYGNEIVCDSDARAFPSRVLITNCILADDGPKVYKYDDSTVLIQYSDVVGGFNMAVQPASGFPWGAGNISLSPLFETNDYHLTASSPCIDAGDNALLPPDIETDLDGRPRIVKGRAGSGDATVDMGAYEYQ